MQASKLGKLLLNHTITHSGAERRTYLGMSQIGHCQRKLYYIMVQGREWTTQAHLYCHLGYLFEESILARLRAIEPLLGPSREFSDFGGRFAGHSDGEWDGDLLEIKSTTSNLLIDMNGRIPRNHFWQVQVYMFYGHYKQAQVIYVARDTGQLRVEAIRFHERTAELARLKAASILEAVDLRQPPECECGRCSS